MRNSLGLVLAALALGHAAPAGAEDSDWNSQGATEYLDKRAQAWFKFSSAERGSGASKTTCVSCHTVLHFALARSALSRRAPEPTPLESKLLADITTRVEHWKELDTKSFRLYYDFSEQKKQESWGTEAVLNALVLALDDQQQGRKSPREVTRKALANLWQVQTIEGKHAGSWAWLDFGMEPWEASNSRYFGAALAALAVGTFPGADQIDGDTAKRLALLKNYLRSELATQTISNRVWTLWASTKLEGLLSTDERRSLIDVVIHKQKENGGWSLAGLGIPLKKGVPDPGTDAYATGLVLHVLQTCGIGKDDPRIARGLNWLRAHQAGTGEWRVLSVNKTRDPGTHAGKFMSDAGTAFAVLALSH